VSAYTSTVRISGLCAAAVRGNTFKKNQSTKTCELDPAIRTSTIKTRVRRHRTGGMKPRILTLLLLGVRAAMAPDVGCEEQERRRGEIQERTLKFAEDGRPTRVFVAVATRDLRRIVLTACVVRFW